MAASQLQVYNDALGHLEERKLASLTENREPRRLLDDEWGPAVATLLEEGYWKHALRTVKAEPDSAQAPNFGRSYSYTKPVDWVRTYQLSPDDRFLVLDRNFIDGNGVWVSDLPYFYVRYISNDANFGWNLSLWRPAFTNYLGAYLAWKITPRIKQAADKLDQMEKKMHKLKRHAIAIDAMDAPVGHPPYGTWITSRTPRGSIYPGAGGGSDAFYD